MLTWLSENISTIIISLIVAAVLATVIVKMIRDKKNGKSSCSCGCGCGSCPNSSLCHGESNTEK